MTNSGSHRSLMPLDDARWKLTYLWLGWVCVTVAFLFWLSVKGNGPYQGLVPQLWKWALPTFLPTTSLILSILGASALEPADRIFQVRRRFYRLTLWLITGYGALTLGTLVAQNFNPSQKLPTLALSELWLQPAQALVLSALSALFFTKESRKIEEVPNVDTPEKTNPD